MNDPKTYNPDQIQFKEAKEHFNEVVINGFQVCRIVGYCADDYDVYYILKLPNNHEFHRYTLLTGVGIPMFIKDTLDPKMYHMLDSMLEVNGCPKEPDFMLDFPQQWKYK